MRFGICAGISSANAMAAAGYNYIELSVSGDLTPFQSDEVWSERRAAIDAMPIRPEAFNLFIGGCAVVGPDADLAILRPYVQTALRRAALVGGSIVVFGSGRARNVPEGFPAERARAQVLEFLSLCADASDESGVTVVIEPLHKGECNLINLVSEGVELAETVARPGVRALADTYHMELEHEPLTALLKCHDLLAHVHTADTDRYAPGTGTYDHAALFHNLKDAGYDARVSIECNWQDRFEEQIGPALEHLHRALNCGIAVAGRSFKTSGLTAEEDL